MWINNAAQFRAFYSLSFCDWLYDLWVLVFNLNFVKIRWDGQSVKLGQWFEMWSDVTYGQVWWPILGIHALHLTQVHTHPEQWAVIYAAAQGEQLRVRSLAQGHLSRGIEGGESAVHSLPPSTILPETRTRNLWIMRPNEGGLVGYCMMIEITQMALSNYLNKLWQHWFIKHHGRNNPDLQDSLKRWNDSKHQTRAESVLKLLTRPGDVLWMALRIWDG